MQVQFIRSLALVNHKTAEEGVTGKGEGPALGKTAWVAGCWLTTTWRNHRKRVMLIEVRALKQ